MKEKIKNYLHAVQMNAPLFTLSEQKAFSRAMYSSTKILEEIDMRLFKFYLVY